MNKIKKETRNDARILGEISGTNKDEKPEKKNTKEGGNDNE